AAAPHIGFRFDHVISAAEAGYFKPHWKTYAKAAEIMGEDCASILFVANHAFDCIGAKSYGMRTARCSGLSRLRGPRLLLQTCLFMVRPWMIASLRVKAARTRWASFATTGRGKRYARSLRFRFLN